MGRRKGEAEAFISKLLSFPLRVPRKTRVGNCVPETCLVLPIRGASSAYTYNNPKALGVLDL